MTTDGQETRVQWAVAILLASIAGYVDGYGLLFLRTFVSFMSGNTTTAGTTSGLGDFRAAIPSAIAVVFFVTGSFLGNLLRQATRENPLRKMLGLIASGIAAVAGLEWSGWRNDGVEIALLGLAMGMMNPVLSQIGAESVSLTFVTGTLSRIGGHLASAAGRKVLNGPQGPEDLHLVRAGIEASLWCGFLVGAFLAGIACSHFHTRALLLPLVAIIALGLMGGDPATFPGKALVKVRGEESGSNKGAYKTMENRN